MPRLSAMHYILIACLLWRKMSSPVPAGLESSEVTRLGQWPLTSEFDRGQQDPGAVVFFTLVLCRHDQNVFPTVQVRSNNNAKGLEGCGRATADLKAPVEVQWKLNVTSWESRNKM